MAEVSLENVQANLALVEPETGAPTQYFEDWLFRVVDDLNTITAATVASASNVGTGAEVFDQQVATDLQFRTLISSDASVGIAQGVEELDLTVAGAIASGTVANSILTWSGSAWTELAELLFSHSAGALTMTVEDSLGVDQIVMLADADDVLSLYHDGTATLRTAAVASGGAEANNTSTGAGWERVLTTSDIGGGSLPTPTVNNSILTGDLGGGDFDELTEVTMAWAAGVTTLQGEDDLGTLRTLLTGDADGGAVLFFDGVAAMQATIDGIQIYDSDGGADPHLRLYDALGGTALAQYVLSGGNLLMDNLVNAGTVTIRASIASGGDTNIFSADPAGDAYTYYAGDHAFGSDSLGMQVFGVSADTQPRINFLDDQAGTQVGNIRATSTGFVVDNRRTSGILLLRAKDAATAVVNLFSGDPDGAVDLYFDNAIKLTTDTDGIRVLDTTAPYVTLYEAGTEAARLQWFSDGNLYLDNRRTGGDAIFRISDLSTSDQTYLRANNGGSTDLYFDGSLVVETTSQGLQILGVGTAGVMQISGDAANVAGINLEEGTQTRMQVLWNGTGGTVGHISITDTGDDFHILNAVDGQMAEFLGGGAVNLYFNGTLELATKSGGVRIDDELEIDGALNHDGSTIGFYGTAPAAQSAAYTRTATVVESRVLAASASATATNNNNVLASLIADLQTIGILA